MEKQNTPFGEISIVIDGQPIDYTAQKGSDNDVLSSVLFQQEERPKRSRELIVMESEVIL